MSNKNIEPLSEITTFLKEVLHLPPLLNMSITQEDETLNKHSDS